MTYQIKVEHKFLGFSYFKSFTIIGHNTEVVIPGPHGDILIRPRLVVTLADGKIRVFSGIDSRDFIVIGGQNGVKRELGSRGEPEKEISGGSGISGSTAELGIPVREPSTPDQPISS